MTDLAIIAGVGPGVGAAVARRFAAGGFRVAIIARDMGRLAAMAPEITPDAGRLAPYAADLSDHHAVRDVITSIMASHGRPSVLVWNAAIWAEDAALSVSPDDMDRQFRLGLTAAVTAIQTAAPSMIGGGGTVLLTGGGLALAPQYGGAVPALTAVKSALRGFVHASAPEFAAQGLQLGTVTIAGQVAPGTAFDPDRIAQAFWMMHDSAEPMVEHVFDGR
jgi:NAD(P)-dependent dehydrogenase (short-subunit alcohol dehydrogenase family)